MVGPSEARLLSGEAPMALPLEGLLNQRQNERSELSGEARRAMPGEGVLNPI